VDPGALRARSRAADDPPSIAPATGTSRRTSAAVVLVGDRPDSLATPNGPLARSARGPLPARRLGEGPPLADPSRRSRVALVGLSESWGILHHQGGRPTDRPQPDRPVGFTTSGASAGCLPPFYPPTPHGHPSRRASAWRRRCLSRLYLTERDRWPPACTGFGCSRACLPRGVPNEETPINDPGNCGRELLPSTSGL